jgi:adenylosuccinate lyase
VYPEKMLKNFEITHGLAYSQTVLLALIGKGLSREDSYALVQKAAMKTWAEKVPLQDTLWEIDEIKAVMNEGEFTEIFQSRQMLKNVDYIFERCGL